MSTQAPSISTWPCTWCKGQAPLETMVERPVSNLRPPIAAHLLATGKLTRLLAMYRFCDEFCQSLWERRDNNNKEPVCFRPVEVKASDALTSERRYHGYQVGDHTEDNEK